MKKIFTLVCLTLAALQTSAAPLPAAETVSEQQLKKGALSGRVLDANRSILPGAVVSLDSLNLGAISESNGFFYIPNIPAGRQEVTITFVGYEPYVTHVDIQPGKTLEFNFILDPNLIIDNVVVYGIVDGQRKAISQQRNNEGVSNIISADQMSRFPDANIGDAMKRVPGINVQYDQGEARFGQVRGTAPDLTSVTMNGNKLPSAEGGTRAAQLDLIPTDMIQTIEVKKVVTADMDGDAIGGSVNLVTKNSPSKQSVNASVSSGYNPISRKAQFNGSASWGSRFFKNKLGVMAALAYNNNPAGSDDIEAVWSQDDEGNAYISEFEIRQYYVHRERQSYSLALDYDFNANHKIEAKAMYNRRNDWENRYRLTYKDITPQSDGTYTSFLRRQTKGGSPDNKYARLERQQTKDFALNGSHVFGKLSADWFFDYATASEERPHERYIAFDTDEDQPEIFDVDLSDGNKPVFTPRNPDRMILNSQNFVKLDELTESFGDIQEKEYKTGANFKLPLATGLFGNTLKFGYKYQNKHKDNTVTFYDMEPSDANFNAVSMAAENLYNATRDKFYAGDYVAGDFVSKEYLGHLAFNDRSRFAAERNIEEEAGNYSGRETIHAGYLRLDQKIGKTTDIIAGVRVENTRLDYSGFSVDMDTETLTPTDNKRNMTNVLPSVLVKSSPVEDLVLRASFTSTLARPKFSQLVPGDIISLSDETFTQGNPDLDNTVSNNVDVMAEYYFKSVGLVSAGIYYKRIKGFIVDAYLPDHEVNGTVWKEYYKAVNAGNANLLGVEVAFQRDLGFIAPALKNFGIYANYTYNHSRVTELTDPLFRGRDKDEVTLPGTPKHLVNVSLYFENKRFTAAVSYNHAGSFLDNEAMGVTAFEDRYYDKVNYLDANASFRATKNISVFAEVNNLLNQPLRYFQGVEDRVMQAEYYGIKWNAGVKVRF